MKYTMSMRESALQTWLSKQLNTKEYALSLLTGDASFRRYYRIQYHGKSWVVMDAPPEFESISPYINVANLLNIHGIHVPKIKAMNKAMGFIILEDLGDTLFLNILNAESADQSYQQALDMLRVLQSIPTQSSRLKHYNAESLSTELHLFIDWFCLKYLQLKLSQQETSQLTKIFKDIADEISQQPSCFVHRDYHSRNIMVANEQPLQLSLIDFQDALIGPYTYDVVSLLKDCYIDWPYDQQQLWCHYYFDHCLFNKNRNFVQFMLDYHMCGMQRHLRVLGTFSRLYLRDGKNRYLADMPRIINYIDHALTVTGRYPFLQQFFKDRVRLP